MKKTVKGIIESAPQNDNGYWSIKVDGTYYGTYKDDHSGLIGQEVEFEATDKEFKGRTYWNASKVKATGNSPSAPAKASGGANPADVRQASIVLQSSYKTAAEIVGALIAVDKLTLGQKNAAYDNALGFLDKTALHIYRRCSDPLAFVKEEVEEEDPSLPPEDDFDPATA